MSTITKTPTRLAKKVDRLGELNAIIAGFTREAEIIKAELWSAVPQQAAPRSPPAKRRGSIPPPCAKS